MRRWRASEPGNNAGNPATTGTCAVRRHRGTMRPAAPAWRRRKPPLMPEFTHPEPARAEVDALRGPALIEFGTSWCGHCRAAQQPIAAALAAHPHVKHLRIEDGPGRRLGRSFGVKLWPTLVFMVDGREVERLVRPQDGAPIAAALARIAAGTTG